MLQCYFVMNYNGHTRAAQTGAQFPYITHTSFPYITHNASYSWCVFPYLHLGGGKYVECFSTCY